MSDESFESDLQLASAALSGDASALRRLDELLANIGDWVSRLSLSAAEIDELTQRIRELLLVGSAPKLKEYAGKGPLGAWLRVLAVRLAMRDKARAQPTENVDDTTLATLGSQSPEHQLARARWQAIFDEALKASFGALSDEQRTLFRLQFRQGLTLDQIATVLQVHRATVARRISEAREKLWDDLTARLREKLGAAEDVETLLRDYRSRLDVSLSGLFGVA
ncbi:MAG: sigma-70 family RNA polymerase sigma factor [Archangium sp.]